MGHGLLACKLTRITHKRNFTRGYTISYSISHSSSGQDEEARSGAGESQTVPAKGSASGSSQLHLYASCLRECTNLKDLFHGRIIHTLAIACGLVHNTLLCNLLLQMYGCSLAVEDAKATFCTMLRCNLLSFNYMLTAHVHVGDTASSMQILQQMQLQGVVPNRITFIIMLSACTNDVLAGKKLHALIIEQQLAVDVFVSTAIVTMYEKTSSLNDARKAFDLIVDRNVVSWNAMLSACCHHGQCYKAMYMLYQMLMEDILPTRVTFLCVLYGPRNLREGQLVHVFMKGHECGSDIKVRNALINLYGKHGEVEHAEWVYNNTSNPNVVTFNTIIDMYVNNGMVDATCQCFAQMHVVCEIPNNATFVSMLSLCAVLGALERGKQMHARIESSSIQGDVVLKSSLINMYGKCGCIVASLREFDEIHTPNITTWNTMLAVYAQHGQYKEADMLFCRMQSKHMAPDEVTFISLLSVCTHVGLVDMACQYFALMKMNFGLEASLEHYHCMIDLLGRAGQLDEMEVLLGIMPFEASGTSWMTLLGASRTHFDSQRGALAAENVYACEPDNAAPFLMLSGM